MEFENTTHVSVNSSNVMDDDLFKARAAMDCFALVDDFPSEDFVITNPVWLDGYASYGQVLPQQYHIEEGGPQVMAVQQSSTSTSSLQYELFGDNIDPHCTSKPNSAFSYYRKGTTKEVQLCFAPAMKQKLVKRCFDFLGRMNKSRRVESLRWEEKYCLQVDESYSVVHKISERNRRNKLSQQFLALRAILPHNPKKVDKISTLTNAIVELNRQKLRIEELEQLNQRLTNTVRGNSMKSDGCSSLSYDCAKDSRREALKDFICEEADVVVEETSVNPDEAIIEVRMASIKCSNMEAIVRVDNCLRDLELELLRIEWREVDSTSQVIEGRIRKKRKVKEEGWETKEIQAVVKHALTGCWEP